jgi:uncharacterized protein YndB with AHSA1/START domain
MTNPKSNENALRMEVSRTFEADQEFVFKAFTEPHLIKQWFGPPGYNCHVAEVDLRVGGHYHIEMKTPEGEIIKLNGVFNVVNPPNVLEYTWQWEEPDSVEALVKVEFNQSGNGTEVIVEHSKFANEESKEGHTQGWNGSLDRLNDVVQSKQS